MLLYSNNDDPIKAELLIASCWLERSSSDHYVPEMQKESVCVHTLYLSTTHENYHTGKTNISNIIFLTLNTLGR